MSELAVEKSTSGSSESPELDPSSIPNPLSHYGLNLDPFADTFQQVDIASFDLSAEVPFFMGGDRRTVLDEVIHLCQFSNNLVAVLGEAGVGKTALLYQAAEELSDTAQCCLIQASVMSSVEDIFQLLAKQLGIFLPEDANAESMVDAISRSSQAGVYQRAVILIDDSHHLNDQILAAFIRLLENQPSNYFHVLLMGDSSLLLRLDQIDKGEILAYDIPLCPFTPDELEQYLAFKLSAVGYEGAELFDSDTVQDIWRDTRGIPATVNRVARQLLLNHSIQQDDERRLGLPIAYMAVVVVLLAALIMAIFYVGDEGSSSVESAQSADPAELVGSELENKGLRTASEIDGVSQNVDSHVDSENVSEHVSGLSAPVVEPIVEQPVTPAIPKPIAVQESALNDVQQGLNNPVKTAPSSPESNEGLSEVSTESVVKSSEASESPAPQQLKQPEDILPQSTQAASPSSIFTRDEQAVMFWPPENYTLQVMAAGQLAGIEKFVLSQPNRDLLRIVTFKRNNAPWYVVLVGVHESNEQARIAIQSLPKVQISAKPWPRKIADVQRNIEDFRRK